MLVPKNQPISLSQEMRGAAGHQDRPLWKTRGKRVVMDRTLQERLVDSKTPDTWDLVVPGTW